MAIVERTNNAKRSHCIFCKMELDILFIYCPWCGNRVKEKQLFTSVLDLKSQELEKTQHFFLDRLERLEKRLEHLEEEIDRETP